MPEMVGNVDTQTPASDRRRHAARGVLVASAWAVIGSVFVLHLAYYWARTTDDDPYISFRYALNLLRGNGLVWNAGEHIQGYSNLLWVLLNAALFPLVGDFITVSRLLSLGCFAAILSTGILALRQAATGARFHGFALLWGLLVACCSPLVRYAVNGWETALLPAMLMSALFLYRRETERGAGVPWSLLPVVLAMLSRSEGPAHLAAFAALRGALWAVGRRPNRRDLTWWGGACAALGAYLLFQYAEFGTLLTGPYHAKIGGQLEHSFGREYLLGIFVYGGAAVFAFYAIGAVAAAWFQPVAYVQWFAPCLIQAAIIYRSNGEMWPAFRIFAGCYPMLFLGCLTGYASASGRISRPAARRGILALGAVLAGLVALDQLATDRVSVARFLRQGTFAERWNGARRATVRKDHFRADPFVRFRTPPVPPFPETVAAVLNNTRPGESIVFPDIGFVGLATERTLFDQRGLTDHDAGLSIYFERQLNAPQALVHARAFIRKLEKARPVFVGIPTTGTLVNDLLRVSRLVREDYLHAGGTTEHEFFVRRDRMAAPLPRAEMDANWDRAARLLPGYAMFRDPAWRRRQILAE